MKIKLVKKKVNVHTDFSNFPGRIYTYNEILKFPEGTEIVAYINKTNRYLIRNNVYSCTHFIEHETKCVCLNASFTDAVFKIISLNLSS